MSRSARLWTVLVANLALVGALIGVGLAAGSLGVWAEGADYLADAAAIGLALVAIRLHAPTAARYAALVNAGWLLILSLLVTAAAIDRLATGARHVHGLPVLVVSGVAATVMLAGAFLLGGDIDDDDDDGAALSVQAVLLDTAADAAAAAGVAATGGIILATGGLYWLDPTVALAISLAVATQAARLLARIQRTRPPPS